MYEAEKAKSTAKIQSLQTELNKVKRDYDLLETQLSDEFAMEVDKEVKKKAGGLVAHNSELKTIVHLLQTK